MTPEFRVVLTARARRALETELPESVASAVFEFISGPLRQNPHRVGRMLREPLAPAYSARRGDYRVVYRILDDVLVVEVISIAHRRDVYRR